MLKTVFVFLFLISYTLPLLHSYTLAADLDLTQLPPSGFQSLTGIKVPNFASAVIQFLFVGAGVLFTIFLLIGGVQWVSSGGDKDGLDRASKKISHALIGLVIVLSIYAFGGILNSVFGVDLFSICFPGPDTPANFRCPSSGIPGPTQPPGPSPTPSMCKAPVFTLHSQSCSAGSLNTTWQWYPVPEAARYHFQLDDSGDGFPSPEINDTSVTTTNYTANNLTSGVRYYARVGVNATNAASCTVPGLWSNVQSISSNCPTPYPTPTPVPLICMTGAGSPLSFTSTDVMYGFKNSTSIDRRLTSLIATWPSDGGFRRLISVKMGSKVLWTGSLTSPSQITFIGPSSDRTISTGLVRSLVLNFTTAVAVCEAPLTTYDVTTTWDNGSGGSQIADCTPPVSAERCGSTPTPTPTPTSTGGLSILSGNQICQSPMSGTCYYQNCISCPAGTYSDPNGSGKCTDPSTGNLVTVFQPGFANCRPTPTPTPASCSGGYQWVMGSAGQSCTTACGGLSGGSCAPGNWNDDYSCTQMKKFVSCSIVWCQANDSTDAPFSSSTGTRCYARGPSTPVDCGAVNWSSRRRLCACYSTLCPAPTPMPTLPPT